MAKGSAQVHIDRSPEDVFAVIGDAANNPQWRRNVVRTEWLDEGPMRVGRRGRQTARVLGREWTAEAEVVEWDPPHAVTWRTIQGPITVQSWVCVVPDGAGSLVTGGAEGGFRGVLGPLLTRLAVPGMVRQANADLGALRLHLESVPHDGEPDAPPSS